MSDSGTAAALAKLDQWIENLRSVHGLVSAAAPAIAAQIKDSIDESIAAGTSPEGVAWLPKKDGRRALVNAAKAVSTDVSGNFIFLFLEGYEVFHHYGTKSLPARPILPTGGVPVKLGNAIRTGLIDLAEKWLTRQGRHDLKTGSMPKPGRSR